MSNETPTATAGVERVEDPFTAPGIVGLYRALWRFAAGRRGTIFLSAGLLVGSQLAKLAVPWLAGQAINVIQTEGTAAFGRAAWFMAGVFGLSVLSWLMHGPGRILERSVAVRVRENLSAELYGRLTRLPLMWHESHHSGETLHRATKTMSAVSDFAQSQFIYLHNIVNIIGPVGALTLLSPITGLAAMAGYGLIALVIVGFDSVMIRLADAENRAERRYSASMVDFLSNIGTLIALRLEGASERLLAGRLAAVFEPLRKSIVVNESKWCAVDLLNVALWTSLLILYAWLAGREETDTLLLGNVFMVYQYAQQAGGVVVSIAANYQQLARFQADYVSAEPIWAGQERPEPGAGPSPDWRRIEVRDLVFTHARHRGERPSLDRVGLDLVRGERIALVGPSGSGKSTLLRVLAGLYVPESGYCLADGMPIPSTGTIATLIPQEADVFEASVHDNLTFGGEVASDDLARALDVALMQGVVSALPQGLETVITERGLNLSGGQRQRLALARGTLAARSSSLLLLDEPTASLDPVIEAQVYASLMAAFPDACIVSSIHRLHLLPRFDRVVLMAEGRVVDQGKVDELIERQPLFRELWSRAADK
jgi:ABC-type multidrug transport system fused ATPase/permease subunit